MAADDVPVLVKSGAEDRGTGQSGGAVRLTGVGTQNTPATKIWFGRVSNEPGYRSLPHHHGEAETGGFVLKGHGRIYFGKDYAEYIDMFVEMADARRTGTQSAPDAPEQD